MSMAAPPRAAILAQHLRSWQSKPQALPVAMQKAYGADERHEEVEDGAGHQLEHGKNRCISAGA